VGDYVQTRSDIAESPQRKQKQ